jgi:hypothetical protein
VSGKLDVLLVIGGIVAAARKRASEATGEDVAEAQRQVTQAIALERRVRALMEASRIVLHWAKFAAPDDAYIEISPGAIADLRTAYGRAKS